MTIPWGWLLHSLQWRFDVPTRITTSTKTKRSQAPFFVETFPPLPDTFLQDLSSHKKSTTGGWSFERYISPRLRPGYLLSQLDHKQQHFVAESFTPRLPKKEIPVWCSCYEVSVFGLRCQHTSSPPASVHSNVRRSIPFNSSERRAPIHAVKRVTQPITPREPDENPESPQTSIEHRVPQHMAAFVIQPAFRATHIRGITPSFSRRATERFPRNHVKRYLDAVLPASVGCDFKAPRP